MKTIRLDAQTSDPPPPPTIVWIFRHKKFESTKSILINQEVDFLEVVASLGLVVSLS